MALLFYNPLVLLIVFYGCVLAFVPICLRYRPGRLDIAQASLLGGSGALIFVSPPLLLTVFVSLALLFWFWSAIRLGLQYRKLADFIREKEIARLITLSISLAVLWLLCRLCSDWASG